MKDFETTERGRMLIIDSPELIGHNTHRLTIHYVIHLLIQDFIA